MSVGHLLRQNQMMCPSEHSPDEYPVKLWVVDDESKASPSICGDKHAREPVPECPAGANK